MRRAANPVRTRRANSPAKHLNVVLQDTTSGHNGISARTSRGLMVKDHRRPLSTQAPGEGGSILRRCLRRGSHLIGGLIIPGLLAFVVALLGFVTYVVVDEFRNASFGLNPASSEGIYSIGTLASHSDKEVMDGDANLSSYISNLVRRELGADTTNYKILADMSKEVEGLKKAIHNRESKAQQAEREVSELRQEISRLESSNLAAKNEKRKIGDDTLLPDWAVTELGVFVEITNGNYDPNKGQTILERIANWMAPLTDSEKAIRNRLSQILQGGASKTLLKTPKDTFVPGDCFPLDSEGATLEIVLPVPVHISDVTLYHLPTAMRREGEFSAPRAVDVEVDFVQKAGIKGVEGSLSSSNTGNATDVRPPIEDMASKRNRVNRDAPYPSEPSLNRRFSLEWGADMGHERLLLASSELKTLPLPSNVIRLTLSPSVDHPDLMCLYRIAVHGRPAKSQ